MNLAAPAIRVEMPRPAMRGARAPAVPDVRREPPRVPASRRALVGCAWALVWTLVWGGAIEAYSYRAQAAATALERPVAQPTPAKPHRRH